MQQQEDKNVVSVGGKIGPVGGSIGLDKGKLFGSANVNGKVVGKFGPDEKKEVNPFRKA